MSNEIKTDVIVVGFGLAGAALTRQLELQGIKAIVIDENIHKASLIAAGLFNPVVFRRLLKSWLADTLIPYAKIFYQNLEKEFGQSFFHAMKYFKLLSHEEKDFWIARSSSHHIKHYLGPIINENNPLQQKLHFDSVAEVNMAGWLDISTFLNLYREKLIRENKYIEEAFENEKLIIKNDQINYNNISAKQIVFCDGTNISNNPWFSYVPFKPTKGEILTIHSSTLKTDAIINKNAFLLPMGNDNYKFGATYNWKNLSWEATDLGETELIEKLERMIRVPYQIVNHEAGIRPTSNDRRPVLGAHPTHKNVLVFNGLGTKGVMLAPYFAGQLVSNMFRGQLLSYEVDIARFNKHFKAKY